MPTIISARVIGRHHTHGYINAQYHVVLTYSDSNIKTLWMSAVDYMDWIEDPLVLGQTPRFDADNYHMYLI